MNSIIFYKFINTGTTNISPFRALLKEEFYAHSANINSVCIGRKSAATIVTGADDQLVNIWKLGRTKPLISFSGHTTEVDCVVFDSQEEFVAAGSRGGTIKVWDLNHEKLLRTFPAHRSSITSLDFHPYGRFVCSGSRDCTLRIFDYNISNKKGCISTFKGHAAAITQVTHSPDGKWVVSGDQNGSVRIWDISTGKCCAELLRPNGNNAGNNTRILSINFHPDEFLCCITSEINGISIWNMETFTLLDMTNRERDLRQARFSLYGRGLFAPTGDQLKVWSYEESGENPAAAIASSGASNMSLYDTVEVGWGSLSSAGSSAAATGQQLFGDFAENPNRELIGVTRRKTVLGVYIVDLAEVKPFDQQQDEQLEQQQQQQHHQANEPQYADAGLSDSGRLSLLQTMEPVLLSTQKPLPPRQTVSREATAANEKEEQLTTPVEAGVEEAVGIPTAVLGTPEKRPSPARYRATSNPTSSSSAAAATPFFAAAVAQPTVVAPSKPNPYQQGSQQQQTKSTAASSSQLTAQLPPTRFTNANTPTITTTNTTRPTTSAASSSSMTSQPSSTTASAASSRPASATASGAATPVTSVAPNVTSPSSSPINLPSSTTTSATTNPKDYSLKRKQVLTQHKQLLSFLNERMTGLTTLHVHWAQADYRRCLDELANMSDGIIYDFLSNAESSFQSGLNGDLTLDMSRDLLVIIKEKLMQSQFENYIQCGLRYVKMICKNWMGVIQSCRAASASTPLGLDLARDDRLQRANDCYSTCKAIYEQFIPQYAKKQSETGELARETREWLEKLLYTR